MQFDVIFIDPPYKSNLAERAIDFILENNLLKENGIICWEHDKEKLDKIEKYNILKHKKYGKTFVTFLTI